MSLRHFWSVFVGLSLAGAAGAEPGEPVDFARDVKPILDARCAACHGDKKQESELRFDLRDAALRGGAGGAVIVPGKGAESSLLLRVSSADKDERMPPEGDPLSADEIDVLRRWIDAGAVWPDEHAGQVADPLVSRAGPADVSGDEKHRLGTRRH
jgi:mono/diheme cytochrome c family protein